MSIVGTKGGKGLYYITEVVVGIRSLNFVKPLDFVIDTGASKTIISETQAKIHGINVRDLKNKFPVIGIAGAAWVSWARGVTLKFKKEDGELYTVDLVSIGVISAMSTSLICPNCGHHYKRIIRVDPVYEIKKPYGRPNLMGIDVLENYNVRYSDDKEEMYLDIIE